MNVTGQTKVWRKDFNNGPSYSRAIASQEYNNGEKGDWIRIYERMQFPKGTDIPNGSIVEVRKGFEAVYKIGGGEIKRKLVVQEYAVLDTPTKQDEIPFGFEAIADETPF